MKAFVVVITIFALYSICDAGQYKDKLEVGVVAVPNGEEFDVTVKWVVHDLDVETVDAFNIIIDSKERNLNSFFVLKSATRAPKVTLPVGSYKVRIEARINNRVDNPQVYKLAKYAFSLPLKME